LTEEHKWSRGQKIPWRGGTCKIKNEITHWNVYCLLKGAFIKYVCTKSRKLDLLHPLVAKFPRGSTLVVQIFFSFSEMTWLQERGDIAWRGERGVAIL